MKRLLAAVLLLAMPAYGQTYDPTLITPEIIGSPTTMTALHLGDDATAQITLNFPFQYFGQTFTTAWVSSNGFVSFQSPDNMCCNGYQLDQAQRNTIYAYWADMVDYWTGNPYFSQTNDTALFGWYNTREYGTNNNQTFEISLSAGGAIQINYGNVSNRYHQIAAGLTGPTSADNIQIFLGSDTSSLSNTSYSFSGNQVVAVDCNTDPNAPECVSSYTPVQIAVAETIAQTDVIEDPIVETTPAVEVTTNEPVQEITAEVATEVADQVDEAVVVEVSVQEEVAQEEPAQEASTSESQAENADRLSPDEVNALAASGTPIQEESSSSESVASESFDGSQSGSTSIAAGSSEQIETAKQDIITGITSASRDTGSEQITTISIRQAEDAITEELHFGLKPVQREDEVLIAVVDQPQPMQSQQDMTSPSSQTTTLELLNMPMPETSAPMPVAVEVNAMGGSEGMAELAATPAEYAAYSQVRIPDVPFYRPRDIYKNRKLSDANWELYRIMRSQDEKWNEMIGDQYER